MDLTATSGIYWEGEALDDLTAREREVLRLVVPGKSNREIGRALSISEDTALNWSLKYRPYPEEVPLLLRGISQNIIRG